MKTTARTDSSALTSVAAAKFRLDAQLSNTAPGTAISERRAIPGQLHIARATGSIARDADFRAGVGVSNLHRKEQEAAMLHHDDLERILSPSAFSADEHIRSTRRGLLLAPLFAALSLALSGQAARASKINPSETAVTLPDSIKWSGWIKGFPPYSGEIATLYGSLEEPGPYVVLMEWYPGYMSAPHTYATDRLSLVLSGTWWVNSGPDFDPENTIPVPAGGFVRRVARTPHYDGVKTNASAPAVIGLFGIAPVEFQLVDASKPAWRKV
jgi:hypothetical protein